MNRRRRSPKRPFVVTIAALATAATACGGNAFSDGGSDGNGGTAGSAGASGSSGSSAGSAGSAGSSGTSGSGAGGVVGNPPPPPGCPIDAPANGTTCVSPGMDCVYEECGIADRLLFSCRSGVWRQQSAVFCNPPPPDPCPAVEPSWGAACSSEGAACYYGDGQCCGPREWHCAGGQWEDWSPTCNPPPPPPCPDTPPVAGTECAPDDPCGWWGEQTCAYGDCVPHGEIHATCSGPGGTWDVSKVMCS